MPKGVSDKRYSIVCLVCQKEHIAKQPYTKFCSNACKCKHYWPETYKKQKPKVIAKKYGLSVEDYYNMSQKCEACGSTERLCVDHCHETGKVRGTLCMACNTSLGLLKEDPERIKNLLRYINEV